jgi:hypothetical protein
MTNKNGYFGRMDEFMPVRLTREELVKAMLKSKDGVMEPRAVEVLKVFGALRLIRYRLSSSALMDDLNAMGDKTQSPWNDKDYPEGVARFGVYDAERGVPLAVLTVFDEEDSRGPQLTFITLSDNEQLEGVDLVPILNELDFPPCKRMATEHALIQGLNIWYENGVFEFRAPRYAAKVTFERTSYFSAPSLKETVDVLIPLIEGKPLHGGGDASLASDNAYIHKMRAWEELEKLGHGSRHGFGSWNPASVEQVKLLDHRLIEEVFGIEEPGVPLAP